MPVWKWMPGMRTKNRVRVVEVEDDGYTTGFFEKQGYLPRPLLRFALEITEEMDPDWDDPATVGCLLAQVREARGEPTYRPYALMDGPEVFWVVEPPSKDRQTRYESEVAALLAALGVVQCPSPKTLWTLFEEEGCE